VSKLYVVECENFPSTFFIPKMLKGSVRGTKSANLFCRNQKL